MTGDFAYDFGFIAGWVFGLVLCLFIIMIICLNIMIVVSSVGLKLGSAVQRHRLRRLTRRIRAADVS